MYRKSLFDFIRSYFQVRGHNGLLNIITMQPEIVVKYGKLLLLTTSLIVTWNFDVFPFEQNIIVPVFKMNRV